MASPVEHKVVVVANTATLEHIIKTDPDLSDWGGEVEALSKHLEDGFTVHDWTVTDTNVWFVLRRPKR